MSHGSGGPASGRVQGADVSSRDEWDCEAWGNVRGHVEGGWLRRRRGWGRVAGVRDRGTRDLKGARDTRVVELQRMERESDGRRDFQGER